MDPSLLHDEAGGLTCCGHSSKPQGLDAARLHHGVGTGNSSYEDGGQVLYDAPMGANTRRSLDSDLTIAWSGVSTEPDNLAGVKLCTLAHPHRRGSGSCAPRHTVGNDKGGGDGRHQS